jgi:hypothetical protein
MPAGSTYTPIATQTLGSAASSVTFSSISGSYTDLRLVYNGKITATNKDFRYQFNGDTSAVYSYTWLGGNGSSASSGRLSGSTYLAAYALVGSSAQPATITIDMMNYSNTTTFKTALLRNSDAPSEVITYVGLWRSTSAITSITLFPNTDQFATGSTFTLYGIASA